MTMDQLTTGAVGVLCIAASSQRSAPRGVTALTEGERILDAESLPSAAPGARRVSRRQVLRQSGAGLAAVVATSLSDGAAQEASPIPAAATPVSAGFALTDA